MSTDSRPIFSVALPNEVYLAKLGQLLVRWNNLELDTRVLLLELVGANERVEAILIGLTNLQVLDAITTIANDFAAAELKPHLLHAVECFDRLRLHRNWLTHAVHCVGMEDGVGIAYASQLQAKGRITVTADAITMDTVEHVATAIQQTRDYIDALINCVRQAGGEGAPPTARPLSSLGKPPLPEKLKKPLPEGLRRS